MIGINAAEPVSLSAGDPPHNPRLGAGGFVQLAKKVHIG
jgi:hypothetical protein